MLSKTYQAACIVAAAVICPQQANADQPVHCKQLSISRLISDFDFIGLKSDVAGYWTLYVSNEAFIPKVNEAEQVCTHELPNK